MRNDAFEQTVLSKKVTVREVGLREGLQSHESVIATKDKVELFGGLVRAGFKEINAVSLVNPKVMPQMADAEAFMESVGDLREGITISALVPNYRGLDRALEMKRAGLVDHAFLVFMDSEKALAANGMTATREELLAQIEASAGRALEAGLKVSVFISLAFGSSLDGWVDPKSVLRAAEDVQKIEGLTEIIISDSVGHADPMQVYRMLRDLADVLPVDRRLGLHLHDTRGAGLANAVAALSSPFEHIVFDAAFGGWGGDFPFIPEALGNVACEDLTEMLFAMGFDLGIDIDELMAVTRRYASLSGRSIESEIHTCGPVEWRREHPAPRARP
jgi:isopropylmalate/homocitrate/citramalate synthase